MKNKEKLLKYNENPSSKIDISSSNLGSKI